MADALLTGIHEPTTSHFALLGAFADPALLDRGWVAAAGWGYLEHELGDTCLILTKRAARTPDPLAIPLTIEGAR